MSGRHLSPEIVSLIHHVELNESGWWKKAVGQVVRGVLWKAQAPQTVAKLQSLLNREIGMQLSDEVLSKQLEILSSQGIVSRLPDQSYKLTERAYHDLSTARSIALKEQDACQAEFVASCARHCSQLDATKVWHEFAKALTRAIHVAGANLFHLLADGNLEKDVDWLSAFTERFEPHSREGLRKVLTEFFAPGNYVCRNQVLRLLTAHFFAEATHLRPEMLISTQN